MGAQPLVVWEEIAGQPTAWRQLLQRSPAIRELALALLSEASPKEWTLIGEGSSFHAGRLALQLWRYDGLTVPTQMYRPWEVDQLLATSPNHLWDKTAWLAVTQSARTGSLLSTWASLRNTLGLAPDELLSGLLVTNNPQPEEKFCSHQLCLDLPNEQAIAATQTMTGTLLALWLLGLHLGLATGAVANSRYEATLACWRQLADTVEMLLARPDLRESLQPLSQAVAGGTHTHPALVLISAGALTWALPEAALKLQETTRQPVLYYHSETFKHGPVAMLSGSPLQPVAPSVLYIVPPKPDAAALVFKDAEQHMAPYENVQQESARPRRLWLRFNNSPSIPECWQHEACFTLPAAKSWPEATVLTLIGIQLLGLQVANELGLDSLGLKKAVE